MKLSIRKTLSAMAAAVAFVAIPAAAGPLGVVTVEPGVHRIGNKDAPLTLTEYVSYTCPHCAHFEGEAGGELMLAYAGSGKVQVIIRHMLRDQVDLTAAMLSNCGNADRFSANHAALMKSQDEWMGKLRATTSAQRARYASGTLGSRLQAIAGDAGLYQLMVKRGYSKPQIDRCLADEAMAKTLSEKTASYSALGVSSTPSFAINGVLLAGTHDWATLKPQIDIRIR